MKRGILALFALMTTAALFAGGSNDKSGGSASGSVYRRLYSGEVATLNYLISTDANEMRVFANLVDALVEYDTYGVIKPSLAQSWEHNADYTVWTFKIRPGVQWVDHTGKNVAEVTAADWVSAAHYVNEAANDSSSQYMFDGIVKNAGAYYSQSADRLEGITPASPLSPDDIGVKALDKYTLQYTLEEPCIYFLSVLSYGSYLPVYGPFADTWGVNLGRDAESLLYNGAYILSSFKPQQERILTKNPAYWDKANVFIDTIEWTYNAQATTLSPTMFTRGETDFTYISSDLLSQWLSGAATKDLVRGNIPDRSYSYFYTFNFEPRFDAAYEPDNWLIAVNNENFRQSLLKGLDRLRALVPQDPESPESLVNNTITPAEFAVGAGKDFTQYPALQAITARDSFNAQEALAFKARAVPELQAAGAKLPIKILMPYNPVIVNWDNESQLVEQQLEGLLGKDYIDIIVEAGPASGFLASVRRSGKYAFMKCNWGADYADPQTWTEPFRAVNNTYNFMANAPSQAVDGKPSVNKTAATLSTVNEYYTLVNRAKAITNDEARRYTAFAEAEAYLINHAIIIPFSIDTEGYMANRTNPFEFQYAPYGLAPYRYKGVKLLAKPMNNDEFKAASAKWKADRAAAIAAAAR